MNILAKSVIRFFDFLIYITTKIETFLRIRVLPILNLEQINQLSSIAIQRFYVKYCIIRTWLVNATSHITRFMLLLVTESLSKSNRKFLLSSSLTILLIVLAYNWWLPGISLQLTPTSEILTQFANNPIASSISADNWDYEDIDVSAKEDFSLKIPSISVDKKIVANVHPGREDIYGPVINQYVAHGKYTKLPDEATVDGNVYLFAHREGSYQGQDIGFFERLDELGEGDQAIVNYAGNEYVYSFKRSFIIQPEDVWVYTPYADTPTLTLQTCENGLTQRLMVQFDLIEIR